MIIESHFLTYKSIVCIHYAKLNTRKIEWVEKNKKKAFTKIIENYNKHKQSLLKDNNDE